MSKPIQFDTVSDIYDYYVTANFDISFFLKETERCKTEILELMCGTGRVSIPLLQAGRKMVCIDYSEGMLNSFRKKIEGKGYKIELINMDVTKLNLGRTFELILLPFHSFSEILSSELQLDALQAIANHLTPRGEFLCTLQNPVLKLQAADGSTKTLGSFSIGEGKRLIVSYMNQPSHDKETITGFQFYEIFDSMNVMVEKRYLEINFRPTPKEEFEAMVTKAGLEVVNVYGDYSYSEFDKGQSMFMIYRLRKG